MNALLPFEELEWVYEMLAAAIDRVGPQRESLLLAKLCLVLASQANDRAGFERALQSALDDLHALPQTDNTRSVIGSTAIVYSTRRTCMDDKPFLSDMKTLRERARKHIEDGAITAGYKADRKTVLKVLNEALATEIVCVLRYKRHYYMASGLNAKGAQAEFLQHAQEEQQHMDQIAERITQLGGEPDFSPKGLATRSHAEYVEGDSLVDMIKENLVAERIAIDSYSEIIRFLGNDDPTTRRMMEEILAMEEEHANDLLDLLEQIDA